MSCPRSPATSRAYAYRIELRAQASGTLVGTFTTTIKTPAELKGTWVLTFAKGGTYTVAGNGHLVVRGKYSTTGSKIAFGHETGDGACAKSGTYTWKKAGKTLKFTRVSDSPLCSGRIRVLAQTLTQKR